MIGTVLGDRYEIIQKIGGGGMALVYKAKCKLLNRYVAIKVLRDEFVNDDEFIRKFRRESQAAASLSHPNIVGIYDVGVDKKDDHNIYYIVMEYIRGKTLKDVIRDKGKLTVDETIEYSIQIAEALEHAHKNHIVHRDIKPHNIMINEDGRLKVTDFGIARAASATTVTNTSNVIGSVHYFSPEQARGGYTDEKSDIYSLGIVMYEMITGRVPFEGDSPISVALKHIQEEIVPPREIDDSVPIRLQNIILKCVKKSQLDRYITAGELLSDLKKIRSTKKGIIANNDDFEEDATQIIPMINNGNGDNMIKQKKKKKKKKKKNKKDGGLKVVFLAILLAFIVVSSLALGFFKFRENFFPQEVVVPDLRGQHRDEAEKEIRNLSLKFSIAEEVYDDELEKGLVVSQKTKAGTTVKEGYTIEVNVSKGKPLATVPNLKNRNINEVEAILEEANLEDGLVDYAYSDTVEENTVISQSPEAFSEVEAGTNVNIVVSQGPEVKLIDMPPLVGLSEQEAKNAIVANELVLGSVTQEPSDEYPEGTVIWQSIEPGNQIETNTSIDLYVSSGPEEESEDKDKDKDKNKDKEVPFVTNVTPVGEDEEVKIRVDRVQDEEEETVYNKTHKIDGKTIQIPLKGKLDAKFKFYYDGEFIEEIEHPGR